jgi:predicted Na+-dependent transporter
MIYKEFFQDAKVAARNISRYVWSSIKDISKIIGYAMLFMIVCFVAGALAFQFPWTAVTVVVIASISALFWIELETVRFVREKEQLEQEWRDEKNKPAHGDVK